MKDEILILEDESTTAKLIAFNLGEKGYRTRIALCAQEGFQALDFAALLLLDLNLPDLDGLEFCRQLRRKSRIPVLMLTGRCGERARVSGLTCGADDYLEKPFFMAELCARVDALLRRSTPTLVNTGVTLCPEQCALSVGGRLVSLTKTEFLLLSFLANHKNETISRETLLTQVWGFSTPTGARCVDVALARVRSKLPEALFPVRTVRGLGYRYEPSP